jgi:hypothetical protein
MNILNHKPQGKLSMKKLVAFAELLNNELLEQGATRFIEVSHKYDYYVLNELTRAQMDYRLGIDGHSGCRRCYASGLSAKECLARLVDFYYESLQETEH